MKKLLLFFLLIGSVVGKVCAQEVIVGTGTSSSYSLALYPYYEDSWWESLYPAAEVGMAGNITSIALQHDGGGTLQCENVRIYMGHVSQSAYSSTSSWTSMSNLTLVYSATNTTIGGTTAGWETFSLNTPFFYNGADNLVVVFAKHANNYSSDLYYYYTSTDYYSSLYRYLDGDETYSQHPGSASGNRSFNRPNIKLGITLDSNFCGSVNNLQVSGITTDEATIAWNTGFNPNTYIVEVKTASETWNSPNVMTYTTSDTFYTVTGLSASTTYDVRVANDCGYDTSAYKTVSFLTQCGPTSNLPITENFDGFSHTNNDNNVLPDCWDYLNAGSSSSNHPTVYYSSSNAYSGSYSMRFYTGSGNGYTDQYAFLPSLDLNAVSISNLSLGLYMRRQGNSGTFRLVVGVTEGTDISTFVAIDTLTSNSGTYAYKEVSFGGYGGNGDRIVLKAFKPSSGNNRGHVDDLILGSDLCAMPSGFAMTAVDEYSVTMQWTEAGTASVWEIEYGPVGFTTGSGTTVTASTNPFTISGLTPGTTYAFQVRSDCGGSTSDWTSRVTASTNCLPLTSIPYTEDFSGYTHTSNPNNGNGTNNLPDCWDAINTGSNYSAYPYVYSSNNNAYSGGYSLRFYTSTGNNYADQYAILPAFDASIPLNTLQVSMMARANNANTPFVLVVGEISGGANTFVPIDTLTITGTSYNAYVAYLDGYTGSGNRIALKAPRNTGSSNNRGYVDDIVVDLLSGCRMVSGVHVSDITTNSADVSWTSHGDETSWIVEYRATGDTTWQTVVATTNPFVLTGLNNATAYQVHVSADCGSEISGATANVNFTTLLCDTADQCVYTFNLTDGYGDGWNSASLTVRQNGITVTSMTVSSNAGSSATFQVPLCDNLTTTLTWSSGDYDDECSFTVTDPFGDTFYSLTGPSSGTLTSFTPSCVQTNCSKPSSITVTNIGATTAEVNWAPTGNESSWNVEYKPSNSSTWIVEPTASNPHTLYGLTPSTNYDIRVQADCGDELSAYRDGSFATAGCEVSEQCPYQFVLTDGYGDGWNGATLNVRQNGITLTSLSLSDGSTETYQVTFCDSSNITLTWSSGDYDDECSFVVYNANDEVVYSSNNLNSGTVTTFTVDCTVDACAKPYNLTVMNVGATSATIGWTSLGSESAWNVEYKPSNSSTWITEPTTSNPHILYGLNASTAYDVRVQADCGSEVSGWRESSFQTSACEVADQCTFTFLLTDGYGDGWNGAEIEVKQENVTIATLTLPSSSSSGTELVTLCDNANITLVWLSGTFDDECSFSVTSPFGEVVYAVSGPSAGTLTSFVAHCTPPTCPRPSSISVSNAGTNTATVSWVSAGTESAWNVEYKPSNSSTWITEPTTSNPHILYGLSSSTNYDVRVQADCGGGDVSDWREGVFQTQCEVTSLPYTENFDAYAGSTYDDANGIAPVCWTTYSTNTTYGAPHISGSGSYHYTSSNPNSLVFTCGTAGADAYAALPEFDQPLNTLHLNFWRAMESTSSGTLTVGYVTDLNDFQNTYVSVATIPSVSSSYGDTISVDFTAANVPAAGYICFHWNYTTSYYSCCIDDISVTLGDSTGSGPVVTDPTVATNAATSIAQTSATLHAAITNPDNVTISAKGFEWKATAGGTYTPVAGTGTGNGFTANLSNLTPNTSYTFKAFITFNGQTVYGGEQTFTTLPQGVEPCNVPTGLHSTTVENEAITIAWNADANANSWNIQYRPVGGTLSSATSATNSYTITGLTGDTDYEIQVQANCGDGNVSDWTSQIAVHTTNVGIESWLENSVTLFPNPAKEVVNVQCTMHNVQGVEVFDVFGKLITTTKDIDNPTRIDVSGLANGMYFVRVTTDRGVVTKSFVKN